MIEKIKKGIRSIIPAQIDAKKAAEGLKKLQDSKTFKEYPPSVKKKAVDKYIRDIKFEKKIPKFLKPKIKKGPKEPRKISPPKGMERWYT